MLDQMKQAKQMYALQKELKKEKIEEEVRGVKVVMNGVMEVEKITLSDELEKEEQEKAVLECLTKVTQQARMAAAKKMQGMQ